MSTTTTLRADFDRFVAGDAAVERYALFKACREGAPVFRSAALNAWVVARYDDVKAVIGDESRFETLREGPGTPIYGDAILQWRGREHQKKGGVVAKRLRSPRAVASFDDFIRRTAERLAGEVAAKDGVVDLKAEYAMWIPLLAIGELLAIEGAGAFRSWYHHISAAGVSSIGHPEKRERGFEALAELGAFLEPILVERRAAPGDDLLSDLVTLTYDGQPLSDGSIRAMTAFLLTAGVETTERALSSLFKHLFSDPARWERFREVPELVESVSAETLRVFPPVQGLTRRAAADTELQGVAIAEGDLLVPLIASANRDADVFEDPDTFVFDRFADDAGRQFTNAGTILPFGAGRHHCAGSQLARMEMLHALTELLARVATGRFADGVPEDEGFLLRSPGRVPVVLTPA